MAISIACDYLSTAVAVDVSVHRLVHADLSLDGTEKDVKAGISVSRYVLSGSDSDYPLTVTVRSEKGGNGSGVRRSSIRLETWVRKTSDLTDAEEVFPLSAVLSVNTPNVALTVADVNLLVAALFGLSFDTLTTKVRDTVYAGDLLLGITQLY